MKKHPALNALFAEVYIICIVSLIQYGLRSIEENQSILIPMTMLSLFVLSVAVMGFLFLGQPIQLYLDGEKQGAVRFFIFTLLYFAILTGIVLITLFIFN